MQVTSFGFFWLIVLFLAAQKDQITLLKVVMFSALFQAGAVFIIFGKAISPFMASCIMFIIDYLFRCKFKPELSIPFFFKIYLYFLFIILCGAIIAAIAFRGIVYMENKDWISYARYDGHIAFFGLFTLVIFGLMLLLVYNLKSIPLEEIERMIDIMVAFVFIIGLWHFGTVMNYIPRNDFIRDFIYSNSTTTENIAYFVDTNISLRIYQSIFNIRFCGPFMEPSYCAGFLAMAFAFYVGKPELKIKDFLLMTAVVIMTVLTYSATAYVSLVFAGVASAISSGKAEHLLKIISRACVLIMFALVLVTKFELWNVIQRLIINKLDSHSAYIRGLWNTNAIKTFFDTKGFGMGYANVRGSSLFYTIPASCGIMGTLFLIIFIIAFIQRCGKTGYGKKQQLRFQTMFLATLFAMVVAISVLDYSIFWMSAILLVIHKQVYADKNHTCNELIATI